MLPLGLLGDDTAVVPGVNFSVAIVAVVEGEAAADRADLIATTWNEDGRDKNEEPHRKYNK